MNDTMKRLVEALYMDLRQSYPSLTLVWLMEEAESQLSGVHPRGGPGVFLNDYLRKAGFIK